MSTSAAYLNPSMSSAHVVEVQGLCKNYGEFPAIKGLDFTIREGEIFGLIGPDGAGKTSTFHILAGIMNRTAGDISVLSRDPRDARLEIGYLTQIFSLYQDLSILENIEYAARIREVPEREYIERRDRYLKIMNLQKFGGRLAGNLSGGMKQKLALCCALIARPRLLLLDEPTTGVDPVSRRDFWDVLASITAEGVTVAVATPYLDEAERCSRIALIHKGEIFQTGSPSELKHSLGLKRLELRSKNLQSIFDQLEASLAPHSSSLASSSATTPIDDVQQFGDRLDVLVKSFSEGEAELRKILGDTAYQCVEEEPTLENVFVSQLKTPESVELATFPLEAKSQRRGEAIAARNISKQFGNFQAVKNLNLQINYGEIYGLLGANGAGKTTTIKMLCGLLDISQGEISLAGRKHRLRDVDLRREIGYMSQKFVLYDDLSVLENLNFYCGSYGLKARQRKERIEWALSTFELHGHEKTMAAALPGGWKQKLSFAASVLHQPSIIFLDEPTSGVDPLARRQLWKYIRQFARAGAAILVTTHFLEEAEHCARLGFMVDGALVAEGSPSEIKEEQPGQVLGLKVSDAQRAYFALKEVFEAWKVSIFGSDLHLVVMDLGGEIELVKQTLGRVGIQLISYRVLQFSLEDAFIGIVQRTKGAP